MAEGYGDVVEILGLCDINPKRLAARKLIGTNAPSFVDFDRMIKEIHPDTVMITTVDGTHARYIVRALELGCDVMTEKPLCTNEEQCLAILDAQKRSGKKQRNNAARVHGFLPGLPGFCAHYGAAIRGFELRLGSRAVPEYSPDVSVLLEQHRAPNA